MRLTFTKTNGKYDRLLIEREGHAPSTIDCPKQGIIPHDMVHYAVESTLVRGGFLTMVADGHAAALTLTGGESEEAVERLVETFQAELWGGEVPGEEFLTTYHIACEARGHAAMPVTAAEVDAVRQRLKELSAEWSQVPAGGSLPLDF